MNINEEYVVRDVPEQMRMHLAGQGTLLLHSFFEKDTESLLETLKHKITWKRVHIPDRYSYESGEVAQVTAFFSHEVFAELASRVVGKKVSVRNVTVRRFSHRDYTLLHDAEQRDVNKGVRFCYFLLDEPWEGRFGGVKVVTHVPAIAQPALITPEHNALCFISYGKETLDFVKYVNARAGTRKFIVVEGELK